MFPALKLCLPCQSQPRPSLSSSSTFPSFFPFFLGFGFLRINKGAAKRSNVEFANIFEIILADGIPSRRKNSARERARGRKGGYFIFSNLQRLGERAEIAITVVPGNGQLGENREEKARVNARGGALEGPGAEERQREFVSKFYRQSVDSLTGNCDETPPPFSGSTFHRVISIRPLLPPPPPPSCRR